VDDFVQFVSAAFCEPGDFIELILFGGEIMAETLKKIDEARLETDTQ